MLPRTLGALLVALVVACSFVVQASVLSVAPLHGPGTYSVLLDGVVWLEQLSAPTVHVQGAWHTLSPLKEQIRTGKDLPHYDMDGVSSATMTTWAVDGAQGDLTVTTTIYTFFPVPALVFELELGGSSAWTGMDLGSNT